jgi:hypothetical protein
MLIQDEALKGLILAGVYKFLLEEVVSVEAHKFCNFHQDFRLEADLIRTREVKLREFLVILEAKGNLRSLEQLFFLLLCLLICCNLSNEVVKSRLKAVELKYRRSVLVKS